MIHENLTYQINGSLFTVHNQLKNIWEERVYQQALQLELQSQGLKAETEKKFDVFYFDKRVGFYFLDLLVEETVIVELKAVPEVLPLHKAQLISYLKGYNKPVGILANFGEKSLNHQTFPNKLQKAPLKDTFDFSKVELKNKEEFQDLFIMANRILMTMGAGYLRQVYRRAFYYELQMAKIDFELIKQVTATYQYHTLKSKEVGFFRIGDLLLSVVTVKAFDQLTLSKFSHFLKFFNCKKGLIFNFRAMHLDYRYLEQ